jgi:nitroreductase
MARPTSGSVEPNLIPYRRPSHSPAETLERAIAFRAEMASRRSVRAFSPDPVPRVLIEHAIMTAASAPSGAHQQPWTFVAVNDPEAKRRIRVAAEAEERRNYEGGRMPPEWLAALAPLGTDWHKPFLEIAPWIVVLFEQVHGWYPDGSVAKRAPMSHVGLACGPCSTRPQLRPEMAPSAGYGGPARKAARSSKAACLPLGNWSSGSSRQAATIARTRTRYSESSA